MMRTVNYLINVCTNCRPSRCDFSSTFAAVDKISCDIVRCTSVCESSASCVTLLLASQECCLSRQETYATLSVHICSVIEQVEEEKNDVPANAASWLSQQTSGGAWQCNDYVVCCSSVTEHTAVMLCGMHYTLEACNRSIDEC